MLVPRGLPGCALGAGRSRSRKRRGSADRGRSKEERPIWGTRAKTSSWRAAEKGGKELSLSPATALPLAQAAQPAVLSHGQAGAVRSVLGWSTPSAGEQALVGEQALFRALSIGRERAREEGTSERRAGPWAAQEPTAAQVVGTADSNLRAGDTSTATPATGIGSSTALPLCPFLQAGSRDCSLQFGLEPHGRGQQS